MGEGNKIGILFILFITIIIGAVLVSSIADSVWENVNTYTKDNDTIDISGVRQTNGNMTENSELDLAENWIVEITSAIYRNGSIDVTLTEDTDYTLDSEDGKVTLKDTGSFQGEFQEGNSTEFVYTHGDNYVKSSVGRTLLDNFLVLFFIIGLVVWGIYTVKKEFLDDLGM